MVTPFSTGEPVRFLETLKGVSNRAQGEGKGVAFK